MATSTPSNGVFNNISHSAWRVEAEDGAERLSLPHSRLFTFDLGRPFGPWIRRVAASICLNQLESQKSTSELDDERDADETPGPEAVVEVRERSDQIRRALASLPSNYRAVVELRHYQEMSYDEIAAELKIPLSDVKSHLFRAANFWRAHASTDHNEVRSTNIWTMF
jgi:RNA polymerase sigma-70 factor (ECF subfamily)